MNERGDHHPGDADMASGGTDKITGRERTAPAPTRTTRVISALLSRRAVPASFDTPASVAPTSHGVSVVLERTAPSILEGHLTWLVSQTERHDPLSPARVALEDQARILIGALDACDEDGAVTVALEQPWTAAQVPDDEQVIVTYAADLTSATAGHPDDSPSVALARSATDVITEILDHRRSSTASRRRA
jgi:hypothetical protein